MIRKLLPLVILSVVLAVISGGCKDANAPQAEEGTWLRRWGESDKFAHNSAAELDKQFVGYAQNQRNDWNRFIQTIKRYYVNQ